MKIINRFVRNDEGVDRSFAQAFLFFVLILLVAFLTSKSPFFFTWNNIRNILDNTSLQLILAIGMTFVISSGGIDLSIGSVVALSGIAIGLMLNAGVPIIVAAMMGVLLGGVLGAFNGFLISEFKIASFVVTIGSMSLYRGISLVITKGQPIYGFPSGFTFFGKGNLGEINPPIVIATLMVILAFLLFKYTKYGQYTLSIGGNEEALRRVGVNIKFYKSSIYVFSGICAGIVGLILTSRLNAAEPNAGFMLETNIIAAVILGGTSMNGGRASLSGTVIACILLSVVRNGLTIMSISSYYQQLFIGFIILLSVSISEIRQRRQLQIN
ncbi:ribose/xylose/arabinose/galactoside ABC-type transport system permease subunit [Sedimentibacter acidaminivorans]|uniref:Ribose/xylose/arabinose/galactoside ABC-type transport system permease subunit n=1 Tax=Sedimentibacter acidaminivorans TaxID=913099 RepID=A0ABS4G9U9_9FIRM|nr:ribose/xylose/arabinose/galactoside ABC-type transport system permease subunit [Sedimentibacter acidaminivorans]